MTEPAAAPSPRPGRLATAGEHALAPLGAALAATFMWASGNMIVVGVDVPGAQLAFGRTLLGALVFHGLFALRGGRMSLTTLRTAALGGVSFGVSAVMFFSAFKLTTVASATVIASLQPVLLLPYSVRRLGERVDAAKLVLVGLAFAGTAMVVLGSTDTGGEWSLTGDLLALGGTVTGCAYFVGTKNARETLGALEYQASALTWAAPVALLGILVSGAGLPEPSAASVFAAMAMVAIPGTGHVLMSWAQKHLDVGDTATIALGVTVVSSIGAVVLYGQSLGIAQILGMVVVMVSLAVFIRRAAGTPPADPAEVAVTPGE